MIRCRAGVFSFDTDEDDWSLRKQGSHDPLEQRCADRDQLVGEVVIGVVELRLVVSGPAPEGRAPPAR